MSQTQAAAIYTAGPSLDKHLERMRLDVHEWYYMARIGVNNALNKLPDRFLDWYAAGDACCYRPEYTKNRPREGWLALCEADRTNIFAQEDDWRMLKNLVWCDLQDLRSISSPSYSITSAIALAWYLGARDITIYGHDGKGFGYENNRAQKEGTEINEITSLLASRQVGVRFVKIESNQEP